MWARSRLTSSAGLLLLAVSLLPAGGCRHSSDLLEAELRTRDNDVRELKDELYRAESENQALMREIRTVRQSGPAKISPEQAAQTYRMIKLTIGRGTGGLDNDDCPGDDALQIILEPRDPDGHTIKAPGAVHIEALEISPEGIKVPFSTWDVPPEQLRRSWRSGFLTTGYSLVLPWKSWPSNEKVRLIARFLLADGRVFEAEKDVTVHLTPVNRRKPLPPAGAPVSPAGPELSEPLPVLPTPRKLEPATISSKSWWRAPASDAVKPSQPDPIWHAKPPLPLSDSVQLLQPIAVLDRGETP
jgi:hypothetical protein